MTGRKLKRPPTQLQQYRQNPHLRAPKATCMMKSFRHITCVVAAMAIIGPSSATHVHNITLALVNGNSNFFDPVIDGFHKKCSQLKDVHCVDYRGKTFSGCRANTTEVMISQLLQDDVNGILLLPTATKQS